MSDYQTRNYTAHGGKETVIGGKLTFLPGAEVEGLEALLPSAQLPQLPAQADSVATTIAALKDDFNALLSKLRAAGSPRRATARLPVPRGYAATRVRSAVG